MAGKTSLVSVIIPAYNCAAVIERCAKSVIAQSYKNIEIIIINDGSTDNTKDVCKNLAKQYKQIKYFETKNQGVSAARNFGMKKSLGDYILFIDADDTIDKKFIEHCMETASANNVPVVYGEVDLIKNGNTIEKRKFPHKKSYLRDSGDIFLNCDWLFACPGALIKKTIIGETTFRTDMKYSEDAYFMFEIIADNEFCFDETRDVVNDFLRGDSRIVLCEETKAGASNARNKGLAVSTGKYIIFIDSDDNINDEYVMELYLCAKSSNVSIVFPTMMTHNKKGTKVFRSFQKEIIQLPEDFGVLLESYLRVSPVGALILKNAVKDIRFDTQKKYAEDIKFTFEISRNRRISYSDSALYIYESNCDSVSKSKSEEDMERYLKETREVFNCISDCYSGWRNEINVIYMTKLYYICNKIICNHGSYSYYLKLHKKYAVMTNKNTLVKLSRAQKMKLYLSRHRLIMIQFYISFFFAKKRRVAL